MGRKKLDNKLVHTGIRISPELKIEFKKKKLKISTVAREQLIRYLEEDKKEKL